MTTQQFRKTFAERDFPLDDHRVGERAVFPAAAYLEMARAIAAHASPPGDGEAVELTRVEFAQAFVVAGEATLIVTVDDAGDDRRIEFGSEDEGVPAVHARLHARVARAAAPRSEDPPGSSRSLAATHAATQVADAFRAAGMHYGPDFQSLRDVTLDAGAAHGTLALPARLAGARASFGLHPSLLDGAFQLGALDFLSGSGGRQMLLPAALDRLAFFAPIEDGARVTARRVPGDAPAYDIEIRNPDGRVCVHIEGLRGVALTVSRSREADALLHVPGFHPQPAPRHGPVAPMATLVCARPGLGTALAARIDGATALSLDGAAPGRELARDARLGRWLDAAGDAVRVVVVLDESIDVDAAATRALIELTQRLLARPHGARCHVVLGASLGDSDDRNARLHGLAAMLRTVVAEHDELEVTVVTQPAGEQYRLPDRILAELGAPARRFAHVRHVDGARCVDAIASRAPVSVAAAPLDRSRVVLISGGLGAIAAHVARHLASLGFARVVLLGRASERDAAPAIERLGPARPGVFAYVRCDVTDAAQVAAAVDAIVASHGPIGLVLHTAGALRDGLFLSKDESDFDAVAAPKLLGARHLDAATRAQPLARFVLFSSISSLFGNAAQSDYAFANGWLDQFAEDRNRAVDAGERHGRTQSLNWGLWREGGMSVPDSVERWLRETTGMTPLPTAPALAALDTLLDRAAPRAMVVAGDPARVRAFFGMVDAEPPAATARALPALPSAAAEPDLRGAVEALVIGLVAAALKTDASELSAASRFETLGFDSFLVIQTSRQLEKHAGRLSKSLFYEAKTLGELTALLVRDHATALQKSLMPAVAPPASSVPVPAPAPVPVPVPAASHDLETRRRIASIEPASIASPVLVGNVKHLREAAPAFARWLPAQLARWGGEAAHAAATEDIAPNVALCAGHGLFFFGSVGSTWFMFAFCGPDDTFAPALQALRDYAAARGIALQLLLDDENEVAAARAAGFTSTRFGVMQVLPPLAQFSLAGTRMRRVRYLVDKVAKIGRVELEEWTAPPAGGDLAALLGLVDRWCALKGRVSPYVARVRADLAAGRLDTRHRLFVTRLDGVAIDAIVLTRVPRRGGWLMDLEFYDADMPLGGLDWSICAVVDRLRAEGIDFFSLGATFGTLFGDSEGADAYALSTLQEMHAAGVLNNDGNFQFKNKYRPDNRAIYLCRSPEADPASIADALLLFGNPTLGTLDPALASAPADIDRRLDPSTADPAPVSPMRATVDEPIDARTDSWGEQEGRFVAEYLQRADAEADTAPALADAARAVFPFRHVFTAAQGRQAEGQLFKAFAAIAPARRRRVLQNVLFPTQVYHQIDHGFEPVELPTVASPAGSPFDDDLDLAAIDAQAADTALVMLELCCNARGGRPTRLGFLRRLSATCRRLDVPLFLDATRMVDNAHLIVLHEPAERGRAVWDVVREICALADGASASLAKDFSLTDGAVVGCNDDRLAAELAKLQKIEGRGLSRRQAQIAAIALGRRDEIAQRVLDRVGAVATLADRLAQAGLPVRRPAGAHCLLLDAGALSRFASAPEPAQACADWLLASSGIACGAHLGSSVARGTAQRLVRLALPVGLPEAARARLEQGLLAAFGRPIGDLRPAMPAGASAPLSAPASVPASVPVSVPVSALISAPASTPYVALASTPVPGSAPTRQHAIAMPATTAPGDMAIVGLAMRCAGASDLDEFWTLLAEGRGAITEVPASRWDWRAELDARGQTTNRWGGFMPDVDAFDSLYFRISPREAELMDPQERLFLETAWTALEHAGYGPAELQRVAGGRVGVFVGAVWSLYHTIGHEEVLQGRLVAPNSFHWSIANRVSYALDVSGPSMAVDTACSSSLTALHLACESIARGECAMAVVGGVNLELHPSKPRVTNLSNVLSVRGRCAPFGADADGYVPGEGVGAVVVKTVAQALADGDTIHAVVRATQVNHGGRTNGYSVPSPVGQGALVAATLGRAGVDARTVSYIEAHGTGTALGDPIEVAGLTEAFRVQTADRGFCALGSVKSNIGHLEAAAGVAGLVKVVLQMARRTLAPSLHAEQLNPGIDFEPTPFFVQRTLSAWSPVDAGGRPLPRRAGVSSFGAGGANAHALVEEAPAPVARASAAPRDELVALSARTPAQLVAAARALLASMTIAPGDTRLADVAFTLAVGRIELDHRFAFVAASLDQLRRLVAAALAGDTGSAGWWQGERRRATRGDGQTPAAADLAARALRWSRGQDEDWPALFAGRDVRRVPLPTTCFDKVRHWIGAATPAAAPSPSPSSSPAPHPLIDAVDPRDPLLFHKRLHASDFVLQDHLVAGHCTLPGVTYVEMARAAVALHQGVAAPTLRLVNVTWLQPIMLADGVLDVQIRLVLEDGRVAVTISTQAPGGAATAHAQCKVHPPLEAPARAAVSPAAIAAPLAGMKDRALIYRTLRAMGMEHRAAFQVLVDLRHDATQGLARMALPEPQAATFDRYMLHPSLMDGALQAAAVLVKRPEDGTGIPDIPFVIKEVRTHRSPPRDCWAHVRLDPKSTESVRRFDIDLLDDDGAVCVEIHGFSVRPFKGAVAAMQRLDPPVSQATHPAPDLLFYADEHVDVAVPALDPAAARLVILDDDGADARAGWPAGAIVVASGARGDGVDTIAWPDADAVDKLAARLREAGLGAASLHLHYQVGASSTTPPFEHVRRMAALLRGLPRPEAGQRRSLVFAYPRESLVAAALVGAVRSLVQETPRVVAVTLGLETLDGVANALAAAALALAPVAGSSVELVVERGKLRRMRRIEVAASLPDANTTGFAPGRSYLVTGGTGGIGRLLARHLAQRWQARLTLVGRRPRDADIDALLDELGRLGGRAVYVEADIAGADGARAAVASACEAHGALHGVLHAAGLLRDGLAVDKRAEDFDAVFGPKALGIEHLDRATATMALDLFVAFSSVAAALGNVGQSDYAAANRALDVYCTRRAQRAPGRSLSMRWPLWADGGMRVGDAAWELTARRSGLRKLASAEALHALERGLASTLAVVGVVAGDASRLSPWLGLEEPTAADAPATPPVLSPLPATDTAPPPSSRQDASPMTPPDDNAALLSWVRGELTRIAARLLKLKPDDLDPARDMSDYGIDSVMLTEFTNEVNKRFAIEMSPIAFFEFPDLQGLSGYMVEDFAGVLAPLAPALPAAASRATPVAAAGAAPPPLPAREASPPPARARPPSVQPEDAIAIVGLHARLPGASDLDEFWRKLVSQELMLSEVPADRFDWRRYVGDPQRETNKMSSKWGGFIGDIDKFDPLFFRLSPAECGFMDPQQRVFLETVWHTIEDAGYSPGDLSGTRTGIFVGLATNDYIELLHTTYPQVETYTTTGNAHSVLPNRISYLLNLRGPSEPVDTACSSSLVALHRAAQSIRSGECDAAIAGGIGLMMTPSTFISFSRAGMLSPDGRCKTFDKDANGYVRGEGSAAVLLKPLSRAVADGDHIYGVLRGSAINHGGYATSLTAPNPNAQAEVVADAYRRAGVDIDAVGYIEAHGTGTPLGDPVEITGLKKAFKTLRAEQGKTGVPAARCGIGSVKSNIGHLEAAAGIAGIVKVLLALKHRVVPPTQHVRELNPYIDLANSPFFIATELHDWPAPRDAQGRALARCAGVSSFGFGGVNAHVVIEEYVGDAARAEPADSGAQLLVLSGKTADALRDGVERLARFLRRAAEAGTPPRLADVAWTLQVGRGVYAHRAAFTAATLADALLRCEQFLDGRDDPALHRRRDAAAPSAVSAALGKSAAGAEFVRTLLRGGELDVLGALWVDGMTVDFRAAAPIGTHRRVPLPGYPFARERYWIPYEDITETMSRAAIRNMTAPDGVHGAAPEPERAPAGPQARRWHPMLDAAAGADGRRAFLADFDGREFWFADHQLNGQPLMPAAGWLEMAAATLKGSIGADAGVEIRDVVWSRPLSVAPERGEHVRIALDIADDSDSDREGRRFVLRHAGTGAGADTTTYAAGRVRALDRAALQQLLAAVPAVAPMARREHCTVERNADEVYAGFAAIGLAYGPRFRSVLQLHGNDEEAVGVIELPASLNGEFGDYVLHPALVDGVLQCIDGLTTDGEFDADRLSVPYSLQRLVALAPLPRRLIVHAALRRGVQAGVQIVDLQLFDMNQSLVAVLEGFALRSLRRGDGLSAASSLIGQRTTMREPAPAVRPATPPAAPVPALVTAAPARAAGMSLATVAEEALAGVLAQALKVPPARIGVDTGFDEFGIDSLSISRLSTSLEAMFGSLPKTLFFEHGNLRELAQYFVRHHAAALQRLAAPAADERPVHVHASAAEPTPPVAEIIEHARAEPVAAADEDWTALAQQMLVDVVARGLKLPAARVDLDAGFDQYGIDSLSISRLMTRLEELFGSLPKTLFFEYADLRGMSVLFATRHREALARYRGRAAAAPGVPVRAQSQASVRTVASLRVPVPAATPAPRSVAAPAPERMAAIRPGAGDIAVIGIAGRYPQADDLDEYWRNLRDGRDCVEPVPAARWDPRFHEADGTPPRHGGFLRGIDEFDHRFFGISPREAKTMDPNERLFLETAWSAVEDAGYRSEALGRGADATGEVGVFVGVMWGHYANLGLEAWTQGRHALATSTYWSIANRVSYVMDFRGPSMAVDTACSSSLSAIHMACEALRHGDCDAALAGGVNLNLHPVKYADLGTAGFLASDGRCRSFGEGGDGYVPGEGVGAVVLKRLEDALRDGDHVHAVIKGGALNHGGRTSSFAFPNPVAQGRLIRRAIERAQVAVDSIGYVEAHGTGTLYGDSIEVSGLAQGFQAGDGTAARCPIGSVKSNIGHLEAASGVAALSKVLLQMRHGQIAPSLHSKRLNPNAAFDDTPFFVQQELGAWPRARCPRDGAALPRRAGISSFGAGGANGHLVVEEFVDERETRAFPPRFGPELVVLSARDANALGDAARRLRAFLDADRPDALPGLDRIAHTLQVGRRAVEHRLAIVADDHDALRRGLDRFLATGADDATVFSGHADQPATRDAQADLRTAPELAREWVAGAAIDWARFRAGAPRRCALPTYAFQRRRVWIDGIAGGLYARAGATAVPVPAAAMAPIAPPRPESAVALLRPTWVAEACDLELEILGSDRWLLLTDDEALEDALRAALRDAGVPGDPLVAVRRGSSFETLGAQRYAVEPGDAGQVDRLMRHLHEQGLAPTRIVNAWNWSAQALFARGADDDRVALVADLQRRGVQTLFLLVRSWMAVGLPEQATLVHVHAATGGASSPTEVAAAGLCRCVEREEPRLRARVVEFALAEAEAVDVASLAAQILFESLVRDAQCCHVRRTGEERLVQRLAQTPALRQVAQAGPEGQAAQETALPASGTILVTGGLGGLGRLLVQQLCGPDVALVLLGRRPPDEAGERWLAEWRPRCRALVVEAADCTDLASMQSALQRVRERVGALTGVIHAAGVVEDALVPFKRPPSFARVLAPKIAGTTVLDLVTRDEPLQFFVMLSSLAATLGSPGQTDYGSANAFLDGFAAQRQELVAAGRRHGRSMALGLPLWRDGGMRVADDRLRQLEEAFGMVPMATADGLRMLAAAMRSPHPQLAVFSGDVERMKTLFDVRDEADAALPPAEVEPPLAALIDGWLRDRHLAARPDALGIHDASELCAWLHRTHHLAIGAADLRRCGSAADLAAWLERNGRTAAPAPRARCGRDDVEAILDRLDQGTLSDSDALHDLERLSS